MRPGEVHLDLLVGRRVRDTEGRAAGRIEEVLAERVDLECVVREYHLGPHALLERLSMGALRLFKGRHHGMRVVPWDAMDLSDAEHPRLTRRLEEL